MGKWYVWVTALVVIVAVAVGVVAYYSFMRGGESTGTTSTVSSRFPKDVTVCIYGAHGCPHCDRFRAWLRSVGANFKFCDVQVNATCLQIAKSLVNELGVPPAIPMSVVEVRLSKPVDGHDVFVFMLIGEFENSKAWFMLRPKLSGGATLIPSYVSSDSVKYVKYDWSYVPMYESSGESVKLTKKLSISPAKMLHEFSCHA